MKEYQIVRLDDSKQEISVTLGHIYNYHMHMHTYYEMTLYQPFDGTISLNDMDLCMDTVTCILVAPSDFHKISVKDKNDTKFIKIGFASENLDVGSNVDCSIVLQQIKCDDFLIELFREISMHSENQAYIRHLINAAVSMLLERGQRIRSANGNSGYHIASSAVRIMHESFFEGITQNDVAARLNISPQYLSKVFRQTMQITFSSYLRSLRLRRAAKLLKETDKSVTEICFDCGFGNLSHFLRSFRAQNGSTPGEYRKSQQHRKASPEA